MKAHRYSLKLPNSSRTFWKQRAVHEHLRHSRAVESFCLGNADEGGDGMTRVVLAG